jgi:signal transduction histidine kinase
MLSSRFGDSGNKNLESCNDSPGSITSGSAAAHDSSEQKVVVEVRPPDPERGEMSSPRAAIETDFLPMIAAVHEFKTPLVVLLGYTDLLHRGDLGPVNSKQREVLKEMQQGAERLQRVIENLLLLYEVRSNGQVAPSEGLEIADVNERVKDLCNHWTPAAKLKAIEFRLIQAGGEPRVAMEPLRLQHVVANLIENALKYTPPGGAVEVRVSNCFWDRRKAGTNSLFRARRKADRKIENAVCISVSDTGPGIAAQEHENIFGDFVQLQKNPSRGAGLGLAIARRLVEAYRGAIWVESEPGRGSQFKVLLSRI